MSKKIRLPKLSDVKTGNVVRVVKPKVPKGFRADARKAGKEVRRMLDIERTDLPRDQWVKFVYEGLCHYCRPKTKKQKKSLRAWAEVMAWIHYDDPVYRASPADAVWNEVNEAAYNV